MGMKSEARNQLVYLLSCYHSTAYGTLCEPSSGKVTVYTNGNEVVTTAITPLLGGLEPSSKSAKNNSVEVGKVVKLTKVVKGA